MQELLGGSVTRPHPTPAQLRLLSQPASLRFSRLLLILFSPEAVAHALWSWALKIRLCAQSARVVRRHLVRVSCVRAPEYYAARHASQGRLSRSPQQQMLIPYLCEDTLITRSWVMTRIMCSPAPCSARVDKISTNCVVKAGKIFICKQ